ncbi:MAG: orotidine-5'-phosphate decarboxylase [Oceanospirillaceae bacterium]|nr:orotidine-5'-phosphate decarboxylase [Oceanospirillaceae bacterium]
MPDKKIIIALDYDNAADALAFVAKVSPARCRLKVGKELFTTEGPEFVKQLVAKGFDVFLDLKFHDIPNTVAKAVTAAAKLGVWMVNVHASGGKRMMLAAREAIDKQTHKPLLTAVTVLTSMEAEDLNDIGIDVSPEQHVSRLAKLAHECALDGVVCSAQEAAMLRKLLGDDFALVTPGIRPSFAQQGDQKRVMTPAQAVAAGVSYLVIGRPITQSADPMAALALIEAELAG